jgi:hypothetical protein
MSIHASRLNTQSGLLGVHHSADVTTAAHTHNSFICAVWYVYIRIIANSLRAALEP